jgi:hypothetical protein
MKVRVRNRAPERGAETMVFFATASSAPSLRFINGPAFRRVGLRFSRHA